MQLFSTEERECILPVLSHSQTSILSTNRRSRLLTEKGIWQGEGEAAASSAFQGTV